MNTPNKEQAVQTATEIFQAMLEHGFNFIVDHKPELNQIRFTSRMDGDLVKVSFPQFDIRNNRYQTRYAELVITYIEPL